MSSPALPLEREAKRVKIDDWEPTCPQAAGHEILDQEAQPPNGSQTDAVDIEGSKGNLETFKEAKVGITEYVSGKELRFSGVFKMRYVDFIVNEILPSGEVLHLTDTGPVVSDSHLLNQGPRNEPVPKLAAPVLEEKPLEPESSVPPKPTLETAVEDSAKNLSDRPVFQLASDDEAELTSYFSAEHLKAVLDLHSKVYPSPAASTKKSCGVVKLPKITDRQLRTRVHQSVRRIFCSRLETSTNDDGAIIVSASASSKNAKRKRPEHDKAPASLKGKPTWEERGDYLHFTLYKENKDTMEVISFLARQLRLAPRSFQFAGTKDRRGVTVQRASVYHILAERLAGLNRTLRGAKLGGFEYQRTGLELGCLAGNQFIVTLRNCSFPGDHDVPLATKMGQASEAVKRAMQSLREHGFLNYYGLQRFGTFSARTDTVGMKILQGKLRAACEDIMSYSSEIIDGADGGSQALISSDDKARARALHIFKTSGNVGLALKTMPHRFSAEIALIRHLGRNDCANDYQGALSTIPRHLRMMYVHAYQSLVWNTVASERWRRFRDRVVEGDLVLIDKKPKHEDDGAELEVVDEMTTNDDDRGDDDMYQRARALSQEEASSGRWTIFDIVLPTPGYDVIYPANSVGAFYVSFMASTEGGGLDPQQMRRSWRDISLSGSYRKLLARQLADADDDVRITSYSDDAQQLVKTDLDLLREAYRPRGKQTQGSTADEAALEPGGQDLGTKIAAIVTLRLGTSEYATMALRELMGPGGLITYKPDYSGGR